VDLGNHWRYLRAVWGAAILSSMSMRRVKQHGNARCPAIRRCLQHDADRTAVCAPGYRGRKRGEVVRTRTTALQMHTRQWVGTYAGRGNGDYRAELASALQAITTYLKHFALSPEVALVRLDGQYGDAAVIAQLILAGVYFVTRGRGYRLLEHPQMRAACWLDRPTASVTRMNTGEIVELFDGGWLELGEGLPHVRVIVARHPAPPAGKDIPVGKRVGEWVYELFLTTLAADGFLVEDVLDLYHGRGADRGRCSPMKMSKKIPIGGVLTPSAAKNSGRSRVNGCGIYASRLDKRCRELSYARSSGQLPKNRLLCCWLRKIHLRSMACG
jgi:hypothetical protein